MQFSASSDRFLRIATTTNYDLFRFVESNRQLKHRHINSLIELMKKHGFSQESPILCYEDAGHLWVLDGQHRLAAARALKIAVFYTLTRKEDWQRKMIERNSLQKSWGVEDYHHHFLTQGFPTYVTLQDFMTQYNLPIGQSVIIIKLGKMHGSTESQGDAMDAFRRGDLEISEQELAQASSLAEKINNIRFFSPTYKVFSKEKRFLAAVFRVVSNPNYVEIRMLEHLDVVQTRLVRCGTTDEYVKVLSGIYNYRARTRLDFFEKLPQEIRSGRGEDGKFTALEQDEAFS